MLKVWIPGTQDFSDQGLGGVSWTNHGVTINSNNNGKIGKCIEFGNNKYLSTNNVIFQDTSWSLASWVYTTTYSGVGSASAAQCLLCNRDILGTGIAVFLMSGGSVRIDSMIVSTS